MQALFVGYGSMAKRHINNLKSIIKDRDDDISVDILRHRQSDVLPDVRNMYTCVDDIKGYYDAVFITNPTSMHYETLLSVLSLSDNFFLEKPAFERPDYDVSPFSLKTIYVACPLRYSAVIAWLHDNYDFAQAHSLRAISSSYLPEWRPGTDYRDTYSAHSQQGGGVSIDLIHEWDYLQYLIGYPQELFSIIQRKSSLEIDSDDIALYIASYEDKVVELHLDYFGRVPMRKLEIFDDEDTIECNLISSEIIWMGSKRKLSFGECRDDFQRKELEHFLAIMSGESENDNSLERALQTLKLAKGIL